MFRPNQTGLLRSRTGYNIAGQPILSQPRDLPFAPVRLNNIVEKSDRRADTTASRGATDEVVSDARIMSVPYVQINVDDIFEFRDIKYKVTGVHERFTVGGELDHYDVIMAVLPE